MIWLTILFGICAFVVVSERLIDGVARVREARWASASSSSYTEHDLQAYTFWLAEKGAIVSGFRSDALVEDYAMEIDKDRG